MQGQVDAIERKPGPIGASYPGELNDRAQFDGWTHFSDCGNGEFRGTLRSSRRALQVSAGELPFELRADVIQDLIALTRRGLTTRSLETHAGPLGISSWR